MGEIKLKKTNKGASERDCQQHTILLEFYTHTRAFISLFIFSTYHKKTKTRACMFPLAF